MPVVKKGSRYAPYEGSHERYKTKKEATRRLQQIEYFKKGGKPKNKK